MSQIEPVAPFTPVTPATERLAGPRDQHRRGLYAGNMQAHRGSGPQRVAIPLTMVGPNPADWQCPSSGPTYNLITLSPGR